jgi:sugar O-acyltransferase (sialic acid O-acetyltransferase NeuD family)
MNTKYYIIGSGDFAKEVYIWTRDTLNNEENFMGFVDTNDQKKEVSIGGKFYPVIHECEFLNTTLPSTFIDLYFGIGNPHLIKKIYSKFQKYNFPNLIHPNTSGDFSSVKMGAGNIITPGCILTVDISIGKCNIFNLNTTIGHDTVIGDFNVFNPGCHISGGTKIGSINFFGTNSSVLQHLKIENNNTIGAMTLINKDLDSNATIIGVPGRPLVKK